MATPSLNSKAGLTYMSIASIIVALEGQGRLARYVPSRTKRRPRRRLFMTAGFEKKLNDPNSAVNLLVGRGAIEAALTAWTLGDYLPDNGNGGAGFIKRLEPPPPEIWEIRVTHPAPQARIFGRFAEPDTLIVTDMCTRELLKKKGSRAWQKACADCATEWASLFRANGPHQGTIVSDYITENCDDFPLP